ncbi:MAG: VCBS repeat-containing protein [Candidatus Krumholzibacteria bacterium]|nr:VCBS repeat-containing protein [Candidatus Krumholzibacteria bacterium]
MFLIGHFTSGAARRYVGLAVFVLVGLTLATPVHPQVMFPGPAVVEMTAEALSSVSLPLEVGSGDFLVSGVGDGTLTLHRYSSGAGRFLLIKTFLVGGMIVDLIPWEGRPLLNQGVVAAIVNPDRLVFLQVRPQPPYFTIEGEVLLEEDPGTVSFLGELTGGVPELAVSLPGVDKVAFLDQTGELWSISSVHDTGDNPQSILGIDLDGDQVRELVTANRGPLSGTLGVFRKDQSGGYAQTQQEFTAGSPTRLASYDIDGDGLLELATTVEGLPQVILLREVAGQLTEFESVELTLPADGLHLTVLFDGTPGLFTSNRDRGLVEFFQFQQGAWVRRNSYYPGCHPLAITSGNFNGDGGRDLVSMGGDVDRVTVMFANPQPGFWGFPALALNASPSGSALADFDGDGWRDLVVSYGNKPMLSFFPGLAEGGFAISATDFPLAFYPGQIAVLDTDDDPEPELAILDGSGGMVHIADFISGLGFSIVSQTPTGVSPFFVSSRDMDADGFGDLLVLTREEDEIRVLFGAGDHTFPTRIAMGLVNPAVWISVLDLNADGLADLAFTDGINRVWSTLNQGDRTFAGMDWLNAGSGARIMAVGDLDQDLDEDLVVVNKFDESLTMFENTGDGVLTRRIGAHTLTSAPSGILIRDLDLDGRAELLMNLRQERMLGVSYQVKNWEYSQTTTFSGGPDVTDFRVEDFNFDDVPDILTLDRSLMLGLTLLNVEQELVAVEPEALAVECGPLFLEIRIEPDRPGPWQVDFGARGRWTPLAVSGQAVLGEMDYDRGTWILTVDRGDLSGPTREGLLRLTVGEGDQLESLDLSLMDLCPEAVERDLPLVVWARKPWPNPFNPLVNARFALSRGATVQADVYDLTGKKVVVLADGWFEAGDHALQWDGRKAGRPVGAGAYLLRISTPANILVHKVMLIK